MSDEDQKTSSSRSSNWSTDRSPRTRLTTIKQTSSQILHKYICSSVESNPETSFKSKRQFSSSNSSSMGHTVWTIVSENFTPWTKAFIPKDVRKSVFFLQFDESFISSGNTNSPESTESSGKDGDSNEQTTKSFESSNGKKVKK